MKRSTAFLEQPAAQRFPGAARASPALRKGRIPALFRASSMPHAEQLPTLRQWLSGAVALRPAEARRLLDDALDRRYLVDEPMLHVRAAKARIAGDANWASMGFKLLLD